MDNSGLGRRFNAGIRYACEQGADFIAHIGSDDWVHEDLFDRLPQANVSRGFPPLIMQEEYCPPILTGTKIAIVDLMSGSLRHLETHGRYGVIPWIIPRQAFVSGFEPISPDLMRGIDGALIRGLGMRPDWKFHDPHPLCRVDFKSDTNITPYKSLGSIAVSEDLDPWTELARLYPDELVALAKRTHEELTQRSFDWPAITRRFLTRRRLTLGSSESTGTCPSRSTVLPVPSTGVAESPRATSPVPTTWL